MSLATASCGDDGSGPEDRLPDLLADMLTDELAVLADGLVLPRGGPACISLSSTADADGDGVPDDSDVTFSSAGCTLALPSGSWVTTSGTIAVTDPGSVFGFDASLEDVRHAANSVSLPPHADQMKHKEWALSGTRRIRGSPSVLTLQQNLQVEYTLAGAAPGLAVEDWEVSYTAAPGSSVALAIGAPLPPGSASLTGSLEWSRFGRALELELETVEPLEWSGTCNSVLPAPVAGEVRAHVVSGGPGGYLRIRYVGCGAEVETEFVSG